jgi:copper oxidase (laccase) domain-containing protein
MTTALEPSLEQFPALSQIGFLRHGFTGRIPGVYTAVEREEAIRRLEPAYNRARALVSSAANPDSRKTAFITAEQVHGAAVAVVNSRTGTPLPGVDGLITEEAGVTLGIYVADCCAIFLVDPKRKVIGLLHSGRKGTEQGIVTRAIGLMHTEFGCEPGDLIAQLSPCVRPPHYEVDIAAEITRQCRDAGVRDVHDSGTCTATHRDRYYSYRAERGKTGRMLALIAMAR